MSTDPNHSTVPAQKQGHVPLRALLVEDSEDDALFISRELRRYGYEVTCNWLETAEEMAAALEREAWDVVIADYYLPRFGALEALALLGERGLDLPLIVVSGKVGEEKAVEAMRAGAHDYVSKNNLSRLGAVIERELRQVKARREKKRAEAALQESEQRYRTFIERSTEGIWRIELEQPVPTELTPDEQIEHLYRYGYLAECNEAIAQMQGFSRAEEIVGRRLEALLPLSVPENVDYLKGFIQGDYQLRGDESREVDQQGNTRYFSKSLTGILENETLVRIWRTQRDITERKKAEQRLSTQHAVTCILEESASLDEASSKLLKALCEGLEEWEAGELWCLEEETGILRCAQTWHAPSADVAELIRLAERCTFSYGIGLPGRAWESGEPAWVPDVAEDATFLRAPVALEEGLHAAFAFPIFLRGEVFGVVLLFSRELRRPDGAMLEMVQNIGVEVGWFIERKRVEKELRESEQRMRTVLANAPVILFALDREGTFTLTGGRGLEEIGVRAEQVEGMSVSEVLREEPVLLAHAYQALDGEEFTSIDPVDSLGLVFETRWSPMRDRSGAVTGVIGVGTDITERKRAEEVERFLAEASALLSSSLDYQTTLSSVADLVVPHLADWCVVDILEEEGSLKSLAVSHQDPEKVGWARELQERYPRDLAAPYGMPQVLRTGEPQLVSEIPATRLDEIAIDAEHREILRRLGLTSYLIVPLIARGHTLGAITLVSAESARSYGESELRLAEDLARRAALAVDNARLYEEAQREIAERERVEDELRNSKYQLEVILQGVSEGITAQDPSGRLIYANESAARIMGYASARALLEVPPREVFEKFELLDESGQRVPLANLPGGKALQGERNPEALIRIRELATGEERWWIISAAPIFDEQGRVRLVVNIFRDFTERKLAEEARFRLATIVESSEDAIISKTLEGTITSWNRGAQRIYGYAAGEVVGKPITILVPPERPDEIPLILEKIRRGEPVEHFETERVKKDGDRIYVSITVSPIRDYEGNIIGASTIARDITERRRVAEALRQSEELYRAVVEQAAENIFLIDVETKRILESNVALQRSLGYTAEELQSMTLFELVVNPRESIEHNFERIMEAGHASLGERRYRRKDGSFMDVEVSASALSYAGRPVQCVVAHDVTERKQAEESLKRSLDVLLALREAGQILTSTLESEEIGMSLLGIMRGVSNLSAAVISMPDERGQIGVLRAVGLEQLEGKARFSPEAEAARQAALETGEHRVFELRGLETGNGNLTGLCLPLQARDRVIGVLEAYGPEGLTEEDAIVMLRSLTAQAASALENARLYRELSEREQQLEDLIGQLLAAQEEERRRVAYEVHDGLAQLATAAHNYLQSFAQFYPPEHEEGREILDQALGLLQRTVTEARRVIGDLRPTALDDFGLQTALQLEAEALRKEGWRVDFEGGLRERERLPETIETALFRIAQEALTNARKHAAAERVRLSLEHLGDTVRLRIKDWGRGFDPEALRGESGPGERVGLSSMQERVSLLGGELEIQSEPGLGTLVQVEIPL